MERSVFLLSIVFILLGGLAALAIVTVLRGFLEDRKVRPPGVAPKVPFIDFPPPPAVCPSTGVSQVGWAASIWSVLNLIVAFLWFTTRFGVEDVQPEYHLAAAYVVIAAVIGGMGGVVLLGCKAQGRRMIAWGGFLFVTITILAFGLSLVMWLSPKTTLSEKEIAMRFTIATGVHLAITAVIASAAQPVGLPAPSGAVEAPAAEEPAGPVVAPQPGE